MKGFIFLISLLIIAINLATKGQLQIAETDGKVIFETNCAKCHGSDGTKGKFGAKNLRKSTLSDGEAFQIVSNGKWIMPKWKKKLSQEQIIAVIAYIKTLR